MTIHAGPNAIREREDLKRQHYGANCQMLGITFSPFVVTRGGLIGDAALNFLKAIASHAANRRYNAQSATGHYVKLRGSQVAQMRKSLYRFCASQVVDFLTYPRDLAPGYIPLPRSRPPPPVVQQRLVSSQPLPAVAHPGNSLGNQTQ